MEQNSRGNRPQRSHRFKLNMSAHCKRKKTGRMRGKSRLYRRLTVFAVVAAIILGGMTNMFFNQKQALAAKELAKRSKCWLSLKTCKKNKKC